jgi:hypothetical protein
MVDHYYHKQDLQTIQTREIVAIIYNVNRVKGGPKEGKDFMKTFAELEDTKEKQKEIPTEKVIEEIRKKYAGSKSSI